MQQENYQDPLIAKQMNENFINIKIDRELNSALDDYLINFSKQLTGSGGWPLHVILTPQGWPFYAFGYLSPAQFKARLTKIATLWLENPQDILKLAEQALPQSAKAPHNSSFTAQFALETLLQQVQQNKDDLSGGLNGSHKFPNLPLLLTLIRQDLPQELNDWLKLTLDQMRQTHLMDSVNGGFFRYTIDPEWQTPHYEKMLYTQAMMIELYSIAARKFNNPKYHITAEQTWAYVKKHLFNPQTQLYQSSQSALDKNGQEGGVYQYSIQQLKAQLSPSEFQQVQTDWQLNKPSPQPLGWLAQPTQIGWTSIRQKLQIEPNLVPIDHKSLIGWNGLLLSGLSQLYKLAPNEELLKSAQKLAQRLDNLLSTKTPPKALSQDNQPIDQAQLDDWVYGLNGLDNWHENDTKPNIKSKSFTLFKTHILTTFYSQQGWRNAHSALLPGMAPQRLLADQATPSAVAVWLNLDTETCHANKASLLNALSHNANNLLSYASYLQPHFLQCAADAHNPPERN